MLRDGSSGSAFFFGFNASRIEGSGHEPREVLCSAYQACTISTCGRMPDAVWAYACGMRNLSISMSVGRIRSWPRRSG